MNDPLQQPRQAATLAQKAALDEPILALIKPELSPAQAVWWACECVQAEIDPKAPPEELAALDAARKWAAMTSEENRRAAEAAAAKVNYGTPAGQAAVAAFWSGGSLAPPKLAVVPPPE